MFFVKVKVLLAKIYHSWPKNSKKEQKEFRDVVGTNSYKLCANQCKQTN